MSKNPFRINFSELSLSIFRLKKHHKPIYYVKVVNQTTLSSQQPPPKHPKRPTMGALLPSFAGE